MAALTKTQARTLAAIQHIGEEGMPNKVTTSTLEGHRAMFWTYRTNRNAYMGGTGLTGAEAQPFSPQPRTLQILLEKGLVRVESKNDWWHEWFAL